MKNHLPACPRTWSLFSRELPGQKQRPTPRKIFAYRCCCSRRKRSTLPRIVADRMLLYRCPKPRQSRQENGEEHADRGRERGRGSRKGRQRVKGEAETDRRTANVPETPLLVLAPGALEAKNRNFSVIWRLNRSALAPRKRGKRVRA